MAKINVLTAIKQLNRPVFTTREVAVSCKKTLSNTIQSLDHLARQGVVAKISRGLWVLEIGKERPSLYSIIPFLLPTQRLYVSFISALHLYGIIEQIPQTVTLASMGHTKTIRTSLGTFFIHRIAPSFFKGFDWYKGTGNFLIAEPEKAFVDCLYLSVRKKRQFGHFPELHFSRTFSFKKVRKWVMAIPDSKIRAAVFKKLETKKLLLERIKI